MALNNVPITPATVQAVKAVLATACTDKTGATTANLVAGYTATTQANKGNGAIFAGFTATAPSATSTTTAAFVVLCFYKSAAGVYELLKEVAVAAGVGSTTAAGATTGYIQVNKNLEPGDAIFFGTTVTLPVHVTGDAGEF